MMYHALRPARLLIATAVLGLTAPIAAHADGLSGSYLAGRQAILSNDYAEAAQFLSRALARDQSNPALAESALLASIGLGRIEASVPLARTLAEIEPLNQVAQMVLTGHSLRSGADIGFLNELTETGRIGPLLDGLLIGWGWMDVGDVGATMAAFDRLIENPEYEAFGRYHKALALAYVGNFEEAARLLVGVADAPVFRSRRSLVAAAQSLGQSGQLDQAAALLAENFDLNDPAIAGMYASFTAGEAVPFDMVRSPQDGMGEAFYSIAQALNGQASDGFTLLYTRMALYMAPDNTDARLLTAQLLEKLEQYELAIAVYDGMSRDHPSYLNAEIGRAEALYEAGKPDAAIEVLMQLAETHSDLPLVHTTLGDTYRRMSEFEESAAAYDRAIALSGDPEADQWFLYYARGIAHERTDDWPAAEADFRMALDLNPGQPSVLNYLGYSLVEKRQDLDEALDMIRQASAARPDSGYITDSLGWVLYRLGRFDEAVEPMERAVSLMPIDPVINDHLGDVYWAVGRTREAEFQWKRALSFLDEPENETSDVDPDRIRRKLEVGLDIVLQEEGAPSLAEKAASAAARADGSDDG